MGTAARHSLAHSRSASPTSPRRVSGAETIQQRENQTRSAVIMVVETVAGIDAARSARANELAESNLSAGSCAVALAMRPDTRRWIRVGPRGRRAGAMAAGQRVAEEDAKAVDVALRGGGSAARHFGRQVQTACPPCPAPRAARRGLPRSPSALHGRRQPA